MKFHKTKDGKKIKLADLETSHLKNTNMEFYNTFKTQFEVLPRLTIIYNKIEEEDEATYKNGFAIEWLWFGVFFNCC